MTQDEAVLWLRQYRRCDTYVPSPALFGGKKNYEFTKAVYERWLVLDLIEQIKKTSLPPMEVIRRFYYDMDDLITESENPITWSFASIMENSARDIMNWLRRKENESEED